jgi:hypothetical protein
VLVVILQLALDGLPHKPGHSDVVSRRPALKSLQGARVEP